MAEGKAAKKKRRFGRPDNQLRMAGFSLPGLDQRTQEGRRYARVITELVAEFGAVDTIRLRELAGLRLTLEQVQTEAILGSVKAREDVVRVSNLIARREVELRTRHAARAPVVKKPSPLHQHLAQRAAERPSSLAAHIAQRSYSLASAAPEPDDEAAE